MNADTEFSLSEAERLGFSIESDPGGPLAVAMPSNQQIVASISIVPGSNDEVFAQLALALVQAIAVWANEDEDRSIFELLVSLQELRRRVDDASSTTQAAFAGYFQRISENVVPHAFTVSKALSCIESDYPGSHSRFLSAAAAERVFESP